MVYCEFVLSCYYIYTLPCIREFIKQRTENEEHSRTLREILKDSATNINAVMRHVDDNSTFLMRNGAVTKAANCLHEHIRIYYAKWRRQYECGSSYPNRNIICDLNFQNLEDNFSLKAYKSPDLISNRFTQKYFIVIGSWMKWASKTVRESDMNMPLINECGKKVKVFDLHKFDSLGNKHVLVLASDGL
ncbi:Protein phosphatase 1H [Dirofilaria immitis]